MKFPAKTIVLFLIGFGLFSFTAIRFAPITPDSVREGYLLTLFSDYNPEDSATIKITVRNPYDDKMTTLSPLSLCEWDMVSHAYSVYQGVDTGYQYFDAEVLDQFKLMFGADLIKGKLKLAAKDYEDKPILINQYNPLALKLAFDKLYQKPTGSFRDIGLQKLYNVSAKQYLRDATDIIVGITSKKAIWDAQVKKYILQATTNEDFYMDELAGETYTKIFGEKEMAECAPSAGRMIGAMLRRSGDGTLPTILTCLKTVLKDYDPEYYTKVALKF